MMEKTFCPNVQMVLCSEKQDHLILLKVLLQWVIWEVRDRGTLDRKVRWERGRKGFGRESEKKCPC